MKSSGFRIARIAGCGLSLICLAAAALGQTPASGPASAPTETRAAAEALLFPGLLKKAEREAGNPLATFAAMIELDAHYRASKVFGGIYPEIRLTFEEFLGRPLAGQAAMQLPMLKTPASAGETPLPAGCVPVRAVNVTAREAEKTRLVIFGEEHHLPQTRSLYDAMLRALWDRGYHYLAAETFTPEVMEATWKGPGCGSGYYTQDPIFASAVRTAKTLGYQFISYETMERGEPGDGSFRDRTQAQNIKKLVFDRDPLAKVVVFCGRGHAAEVAPADGWTPMASVLKKLTGIDPFTIYAPTMSQRNTREEEHPLYRFATAHALVAEPTIFVNAADKSYLGSGNCDAYVFWPRFAVVDGRPDWMTKTMGRKPVPIPAALLGGRAADMRLAQAFFADEKETLVPVDQILLMPGEPLPVLMLPTGSFWLRVIDGQGAVLGPAVLKV